MKYFQNEIFKDHSVNAICDKIYYLLDKRFPNPRTELSNHDLDKVFVLSGLAAAILQEELVPKPLPNIVFQCLDDVILEWAEREFPPRFGCSVVRFKGRKVFYFKALIVELWKCSSISLVIASGVATQGISLIPTETLQ